MLRWIIIVMVVVPALEIWVLLEMGRLIGGWQTFALILLTGVIGAFLSKREFQRVLNYARHELSQGHIPTASILDGIAIFTGGLLLLTPGLLTDAVGFLLLLPLARNVFNAWLLLFIRKKIDSGQFRFYYRR